MQQKTEEKVRECEIWRVCDYKEDYLCNDIYCKKKYQCWTEERECKGWCLDNGTCVKLEVNPLGDDYPQTINYSAEKSKITGGK